MSVPSAALSSSLLNSRVAFTGRLASMSRAEAKRLVIAAGGLPVEHVSRRLSVLVIGMDGWPLLADGTVSRKLGRAEALNRGGAGIRIVSDWSLIRLVADPTRPAGEILTANADDAVDAPGADQLGEDVLLIYAGTA